MTDWYCDELLSGKTPVEVVFETDQVIAFHHTRPHYEVHVVVVPKRHVESLLDVGPDDGPLLAELLAVVQRVAQVVIAQVGGAHVVTNLGEYQESKHLHVHVGRGSTRQSPG